jgi:cation diffusion facilitator CzcD-associated flavoprotein CzcO
MNGLSQAQDYDVIIIGAGLAGINAAYRVQEAFPDYSYAILESREELGGTWNFFKYPGIRSDTDLYTFGFPFNPWSKANSVATGDSIEQYINDTADKFAIRDNVLLKHKVVGADWSSEQQRWRLTIDNNGTQKSFWTKWILAGTGYYDYDEPLKASIPGLQDFKGVAVHPQFWPPDLDYKNKKVVVIGSGATAITLLPALTDSGVGQVTMLQRSPSYVLSLPQRQPGDPPLWHERIFPQWVSSKIERMNNIILPYLFFIFCRCFPKLAAGVLRKGAKEHLPKGFEMSPHFYPAYKPWDQRMCLCPDADFFKCFESGRAHIVTATIKSVVEDGIVLNSGEKLDADIIVTATGLKISLLGKMALTKDKELISIPDQFLWRSCMATQLPNFGFFIGYVNASWTLGTDSSARILVRVMKHMRANGYTAATPEIQEDEKEPKELPLGLQSTYLKDAEKVMPMCGGKGVWKKRKSYIFDWFTAGWGDIEKGIQYERKLV